MICKTKKTTQLRNLFFVMAICQHVTNKLLVGNGEEANDN